MKSSSNKELFLNPIVLASMGAVVLIAIGSEMYYVQATRVPATPSTGAATSTPLMITAAGTVEPAENPDLAFASGGRVTSVNVRVDQAVRQGAILASLDTASLSAQRAQAEANVAAAQAQLAEMRAGARQTDIDAKQTAIDQANTTLASLYTSVATNIAQSYDKAFSGLSQNTDSLFSQPNSNNPALIFSTTNSQLANSAAGSHVLAKNELATWQSETDALSAAPTREQIDSALVTSIAHLQVLRTYSDQLLTALGNAIPSTSFSQSSITAAQISVGSYRDSVNTLVSALQISQQQLASAKLGVQSAHDALDQATAGATPEHIAAQQASVDAAEASVNSIDAQIRNNIITAPFSGTVASVHIKTGDIVAANTPALSLNPESALQIVVYFSEIDITKIHTGDTARVTLDAYGNGRAFRASVVSVDSAPSQINGTSGYKVTLQFLSSDAAITSGMTANITIPVTK